MASHYKIQKSHVLAVLPRPFQQRQASPYHIGAVYGHSHGRPGRMKRSELVVGINGEATNIYDIATSSLITSYPTPPDHSFVCPPVSLRIRRGNGKGSFRYTYAVTTDAAGHSITVFQDAVKTKKAPFKTCSPVCYLGTSSSMDLVETEEGVSIQGAVLAVCKNGDVFCFDPQTLEQRWRDSAARLSRDILARSGTEYNVEFVATASTKDVVAGLFGGRPDAVTVAFPQHFDAEKENPDSILLVTSSQRNGQYEKSFSVLGLLPAQQSTESAVQWMVRLHTASIPVPPMDGDEAPRRIGGQYQLHLRSGSLLELLDENLAIHDLTAGIPRVRHRLHVPDVNSFLRLSGKSVLTSSPTSISIYNAAFHSLQTSIAVDNPKITTDTQQGENRVPATTDDESRFVMMTHFTRLDLVVGLLGTKLVGLEIEPPQVGGKRSHADGLLIDSIGRGTWDYSSHESKRRKQSPADDGKAVLDEVAEMEQADEYLSQGDLGKFEDLLARKFGVSLRKDAAQPNGAANGTVNGTTQAEEADEEMLPEWEWLESEHHYPKVEGNWVQYAISRVFSVDWEAGDKSDKLVVNLAARSSNTVIYLVVAGHLMLGDVRAACGGALQHATLSDATLARDLLACLIDVDPNMHLLLNYTSSTYLGAVELVLVVRTLMRSLDYIRNEAGGISAKLLTMGDDSKAADEGTGPGSMDLDELEALERQLQVTEDRIADDDDDDADARPAALMSALAKLSSRPKEAVVDALKSNMSRDEVFALIFILRSELVRGGWTSRYIGGAATASSSQDDETADAPPPDESLGILADLLSRCIDAIGLNGWHGPPPRSSTHAPPGDHATPADLLNTLVLEISAALEGLEEAVALRNILEPVLKYAEGKVAGLQRAKAGKASIKDRESKGQPINVEGPRAKILPLDLRGKTALSDYKVGPGGRLIERTKREKAMLTLAGKLEQMENQGPRAYMRSYIAL